MSVVYVYEIEMCLCVKCYQQTQQNRLNNISYRVPAFQYQNPLFEYVG